jgi:hypothetical protein
LHSIVDQSTLDAMKSGGTITVCLLLAAFTFSSFAGAIEPCDARVAASGTGYMPARESSDHRHSNKVEQQQAVTECTCCDGCIVAACYASASNPAAPAFASIEANYDEPDWFAQRVTFWRDGPVVHPPFRPPIQPA